jgi:3-phosphoshikimate 1-carboxyvinyltransferase
VDKILNNININKLNGHITITGSKSESNRLLILKKIFPSITINNLSNADDTLVLQKVLKISKDTVDIGHAGTAMRFLTAYYAVTKEVDVIITGSNRMQQRPIKVLVDALKSIGANISYLKEEGYPPLRIKGKELLTNSLSINANVSSQYISALLLIAPSLKEGLTIKLLGELTSIPYIQMTLTLLSQIGIKTSWVDNTIQVFPKVTTKEQVITVESDWSAASYYYSTLALSDSGTIELSYFKEDSLQGDKALADIYTNFGIETTFQKNSILLKKITNFKQEKHLKFNLQNTPDIAQTIAVTCFGLKVSCELTGLHTLKIKETDRLEALKIELEKFGAKVRITDDSFHLKSVTLTQNLKNQNKITINTYNDHRMAMAFAPLSLKYVFTIKEADVVSKSYPEFWKHFDKLIN